MDKVYKHQEVEERWYRFWEKSGFFKPEINPRGQPYTIILPPPNANADLHFGHAMYATEDILIRYHRMKGKAALWLPGADHAGFETQFVFEKHLVKKGKSRFDFDRETLYREIWDFVQENRGRMENQLRRLGFSLDWSRMKFTLDKDIVRIVYQTFKKMHDDGLVYRAKQLVNYCTKDGTSFSDLEVVYKEREDPLYYIKYGPLTLATTRPETKFGDTAVAVHPNDERYQKHIGKELEIETVLGKAKIKVVADRAVDPEFGTGVVKVTPAHDATDFEIGQRHNLEIKQVIGFDGRMNEKAGKFAGLTVVQAREAVVEEIEKKSLIKKIDLSYKHRVGLCYKCGAVIEPLPLEQWFVKTGELAKKAIEVVRRGEIEIHPKHFEKNYFNWLKNIKDWNISRQLVWGIRIPAWECQDCHEWVVTLSEIPQKCTKCNSNKLKQDNDTFDTWFSSSQWPFAALRTSPYPGDFEKFYPTQVLETMYDILLFWVARMVMLGLYITNKPPFENVVIHGMVKDPLGQKMSKSRGNVVSPTEIADQYGADAVRMTLVYGIALGHDQSLSHPKLQAMRNFTNKLWNIGRYVIEFKPEKIRKTQGVRNSDDEAILKLLEATIKKVTEALDGYRFNDAAETLYEFIWHQFADIYLEKTKDRREEAQPVLEDVFRTSLELLHPFMPFITEELWQKLPHHGKSIMIADWPKNSLGMNNDYVRKTIAAYDANPRKYIKSTKGLAPLWEIEKFVKYLPPNGLVLDAGCASGRDTKVLIKKGSRVVGIDLSRELLKIARKSLPQVDFLLMDIRKLKFPNNYLDGVWCHAVLLHLSQDDIKRALREFHRVLKNNGVLFISFKEGEGSEEKLEAFSSNKPRFFTYQTKESLTKLLNEAGFKLVEIYLVNERERFGEDKRDLNWVYSFSIK